MKRRDLKTGMFGKMSNGKLFVIVNDLIVYQDGGFDYIKELDKNLGIRHYEWRIEEYWTIEILVVANCFNIAKNLINNRKNRSKDEIIYDRRAQETPIAMTIAEIEEELGIKNLRIKGE